MRSLLDLDNDVVLRADPETPLESLFGLPATLGVLGLIIGVPWLLLSNWLPAGSGIFTPGSLIVGGGLLLWVGLYLIKQIDAHYLIHLENRDVVYYRRLFGDDRLTHVCDFSEVHCIATETKTERKGSTKHRTLLHRHGLSIVLKSGKKLRIIDPLFESLTLVSQQGRRLADAMGVAFRSGHGKLVVRRTSNGLDLKYKEASHLHFLEQLQVGCLVLVCLGMLILAAMKSWDENVSPIVARPVELANRVPTQPSLWAVDPASLVVTDSAALNADLKRGLVKSVYGPAPKSSLALPQGSQVEILSRDAYDYVMKEKSSKRTVKFQVARVRVTWGEMTGKTGWTVVKYDDPKLYPITIWVPQPPKNLEQMRRKPIIKKGVDLTCEVLNDGLTNPQGERIYQVLVINRGGVAFTGDALVKVTLDGKALKDEKIKGPLKADQAKPFVLAIPPAKADGQNVLTLVVDPHNEHPETDERNNTQKVLLSR